VKAAASLPCSFPGRPSCAYPVFDIASPGADWLGFRNREEGRRGRNAARCRLAVSDPVTVVGASLLSDCFWPKAALTAPAAPRRSSSHLPCAAHHFTSPSAGCQTRNFMAAAMSAALTATKSAH